MTRAEAADRMSLKVDQLNTLAMVRKRALPEVRAAIDNGTIRTIGHAYEVVTPNKDERREGLTSEEKQRQYLAKQWKPRQTTKPQRPSIPFTASSLKGLTDDQADVIMGKLAPKANRVRKPQGEQWAIVKLTEEGNPK